MNETQFLLHQAKELIRELNEDTTRVEALAIYAAVMSLVTQAENQVRGDGKEEYEKFRDRLNSHFGFRETTEYETRIDAVDLAISLDSLKSTL